MRRTAPPIPAAFTPALRPQCRLPIPQGVTKKSPGRRPGIFCSVALDAHPPPPLKPGRYRNRLIKSRYSGGRKKIEAFASISGGGSSSCSRPESSACHRRCSPRNTSDADQADHPVEHIQSGMNRDSTPKIISKIRPEKRMGRIRTGPAWSDSHRRPGRRIDGGKQEAEARIFQAVNARIDGHGEAEQGEKTTNRAIAVTHRHLLSAGDHSEGDHPAWPPRHHQRNLWVHDDDITGDPVTHRSPLPKGDSSPSTIHQKGLGGVLPGVPHNWRRSRDQTHKDQSSLLNAPFRLADLFSFCPLRFILL